MPGKTVARTKTQWQRSETRLFLLPISISSSLLFGILMSSSSSSSLLFADAPHACLAARSELVDVRFWNFLSTLFFPVHTRRKHSVTRCSAKFLFCFRFSSTFRCRTDQCHNVRVHQPIKKPTEYGNCLRNDFGFYNFWSTAHVPLWHLRLHCCRSKSFKMINYPNVDD